MKRIRAEKQSMLAEVKGLFDKAGNTILVGYRGLSFELVTSLRGKLKSAGAGFAVARNVYIKRAASEKGLDGMADMVEGPTAVISGDGDVVRLCKDVFDFAKQNEALVIKGGSMDGAVITASDIEAMSRLPSRQVLIGRAVCGIAAPLSGLVGVMKQKLGSLLYVLKALENKKSE